MSDLFFKSFEEDRDLRDHLIGFLHVDSSLDDKSIARLLSASEISKVVDLGPAEISRSLSRLRTKGLIREVREEHPLFDKAATLSRVFAMEADIRREFEGTALTEVFVTHTIESPEDVMASHALTIDICTFYAARLLRNYLKDHMETAHVRFGVSWGYTVQKVIDHFKRLIDMGKLVTKDRHPTWDILNIAGDTHPSMAVHEIRSGVDSPDPSLGTMGSSALVMARELAAILFSPHHAFAAPGWVKIDKVATPRDREELETMLNCFPAYSRIFEHGGDLDVSEADVILTGIGGQQILRDQLVNTGRLGKAEPWPEGLIGDCSGVLLSRESGPVHLDGEDRAAQLARTMIGIKTEQLEAVAARAEHLGPEKRPLPQRLGVVMVAAGSNEEKEAKQKAEAVRVAVNHGLVNVLILESAIAKHLVPA